MKNAVAHEVTLKGKVEITAEELADLFWSMDAESQAIFFNSLGSKPGLPFQLKYVSQDPYLSMKGRHAMSLIGDHSDPLKKA